MKKFVAKELIAFLTRLDSHLNGPFELIIIGGTAGIIGYGLSRATTDIDTHNKNISEIEDAINKTKKELGLDIPLGLAGIEDPPYLFEDRLIEIKNLNLKDLVIKVPEKHDLVLMKTVRGEQQDIDFAEEMKKESGLDYETFVNRYIKEMGQVIGRRERIDLNFILLMETLFGDEAGGKARARIRS